MSERKNIDRLFQEKFKDFEATPPEVSWANIEAKLDGKKKKRIIPFWWKLSGVAAVFLIGFMVSKSIYDDNSIRPDNSVVNQENSIPNQKTTTDGLNENGKIQTENAVANEENPIDPKNVNTVGSDQNESKGNDPFKKNNAVANENNVKKSGSKKELKNNVSNTIAAVATTSDERKSNGASEEKNKFKNTINSSESAVADGKSINQRSLKNKTNPEKNKTTAKQSGGGKSENQLAQNSKENNDNTKSTAENGIAQNQNDKNPKTTIDSKNISLDGLKGETNSKIIAQETVKKVNDTTAKNSVVSNALEELLNEKESNKQKQESKRNRWQLTSNVAPVFLGSVAKGSPIDPTLGNNSKSTNTNIGYGLGVSYGVSKKFSVRTGLNKVNVSYNTNDISFFTAIEARTMQNVKPTASSASIQILNNTSVSTATGGLGSEAQFLPFENSITHKNSGYLKQEMGYLEMPVEMTYNLIDKKFGIKIIGGISTLFLQDNRITIISENRDTVLGEASNLSDVHFSTNLGLGIKYGFMKSFEFNIEPTFKYQLNTYTGNAGNFKPYILGVYSGISYKF